MCNAAKHPPGCGCGFGPPYPPTYSAVEVKEWSDQVLEKPDLVRRGLAEAAWDDQSIERFVRVYLEIRNSNLPRETMISQVRELLGWRRRVVDSVTEDWINVPLYRFGAPAVDNAVVEYNEGDSFTGGGGWRATVFGIGTGDTTTVHVNKSRTFVAGAGTWKQVFVPVRLQVSSVSIYERDRLVGRGHDAQVAPLRDGEDKGLRKRGCRTVPTSKLGDRPLAYDDVLECQLSSDLSGAIHRDARSWETDVAHEVSAKLGKIVDVSALVSVKRTRRLELSFVLPSGHDYKAYLCPGTLWWERP